MTAVAYSEDSLLGGRVRLIQPQRGYRVGIDPVILAAAVAARAGDRVGELGAGVGAAALCLAIRVPGVTVNGLEADPDLVRLASAGAERTGVSERVRFTTGDLVAPPSSFVEQCCDHVMANPPHLSRGAVRPPGHPGKAAATIEGEAGLPDWLRAAAALTRPGGTVTLIHRADRLDDVLAAMAGCTGAARLGEVAVLPLWPGRSRPAKRVVVAARKGSRGPMCLLPGLVLHGEDGAFTAEAQAVLREGKGIAVWRSLP